MKWFVVKDLALRRLGVVEVPSKGGVMWFCSSRIAKVEWGQAQQPTRCLGLGIQNFTVVQEAAYAASHGIVARLLARCITIHEKKDDSFESAAPGSCTSLSASGPYTL